MDISILVNLSYIASSILFIVGLKMLGSPDTARRGNFLSSSGMLLAVLITLLDQNIIDYRYIAGALVAGSLVGFFAATRVKMTSMPEMVAIFNGFGGIASLLVGSAEYVSGAFDNPAFLGAIFLTVLIGGITFTGSIIAYGKLSETISGKPYLYKGQQFVNGILLFAILLGWYKHVVYTRLYQFRANALIINWFSIYFRSLVCNSYWWSRYACSYCSLK